jgi:hypothetical protein
VKNDESSLGANPFREQRVQPPLIVNRLDGKGALGKNKDSNNGASCGFSFQSKVHLSLGYRNTTQSGQSQRHRTTSSTTPSSDGKPIQVGWLTK